MRINNKKVKQLYNFLLENEDTDTDYWWSAGGDSNLVYYLTNFDSDLDWEELKEQLKLWSNNKLEILSYCILSDCGYTKDEFKKFSIITDSFENGMSKIVKQRFDLIIPIIEISKSRNEKADYILMEIKDNLMQFVDFNLDLFLEEINYFKPKLIEIFNQLDIKDINSYYPNSYKAFFNS